MSVERPQLSSEEAQRIAEAATQPTSAAEPFGERAPYPEPLPLPTTSADVAAQMDADARDTQLARWSDYYDRLAGEILLRRLVSPDQAWQWAHRFMCRRIGGEAMAEVVAYQRRVEGRD